jgi:sterol desaturase/sphingolipid hydroxylase (fatty acid hydroxylase superfamily)
MAAFGWLYQFRLLTLPDRRWFWLPAMIVGDLWFYLLHRWMHEVRLGWAFHVVHHSSKNLNLSTGMRQSWLSPLVLPLVLAPLPLLGFSPLMASVMFTGNVVLQIFVHTQTVGKLGWMDAIFNTPRTIAYTTARIRSTSTRTTAAC